MDKINKIYKKIKETEDEDDKNILINYFMRKIKQNYTEISENENDKYLDITSTYKKIDPILEMIKNEKFDKFKKIILKIKIDWSNYFNKKNTPLHHAIENGDTRIIKLLLENNYPIWLPNKKNISPLELSCLRRDILMISYFYNYNADLKKIIYFRENNKHIYYKNKNFDFMILAKKILIDTKYHENFRNIKEPILIGLGKYTWNDFHDSLGIIIKDSYPDLFDWYLEIYRNDENKYNENEWLNFWVLFNFPFNIGEYHFFFKELDFLFNYLTEKKVKDINLKINYKFKNDYTNIYSKEFLELVLKLWTTRKN